MPQQPAIYMPLCLLVRADDDDRFALETLKGAGVQIDWSYADSGPKATGLSVSAVHRGRFAMKPAERAALQDTLRDQATIHGLVVTSTGEGTLHGQAMDIIAVAPKGREHTFARISVEGNVGQEMRISLDEAIRLAGLRDPRAASINLEISFADKYTPRTGDRQGRHSHC